jgi:WD40 repeat protein
VEEAASIAGAHKGWVYDVSVCCDLMATASVDWDAAVWRVDSRECLAKLQRHTNSVLSVDMNDRLAVTASFEMTVRVYNAERCYSGTAVLD